MEEKVIVLSKKIKMLRESRGLSQAEMGKELDIPQPKISRWEKGISIPDIFDAFRLSDFFGIPIQSFSPDSKLDKLFLKHDTINSKDFNIDTAKMMLDALKETSKAMKRVESFINGKNQGE